MRVAFKEWAIIVDALARGRQILVLRKGGISEGRGGFSLDHERFWLFPTLFHQQGDMVLTDEKQHCDKLLQKPHDPSKIEIRYYAEVIAWKRIESADEAHSLVGQHIWKEEVIQDRFDWSRRKDIHALAVRVHQIPLAVELPMHESYGGCKSWLEFTSNLDTSGACPVLKDGDFLPKLKKFSDALQLNIPIPGINGK